MRSKYKDLEIEVTKLWQLKTLTVPVVIGAFGIITKGVQISGKVNINELQKIALTDTAHILCKALTR